MRELTKEEAIEEHRKMWRWIAEETEERQEIVYKEDYIEDYFPDEKISCDCFCCEYNKQKQGKNCKFCPIDWGSKCDWFMCLRKEIKDDNKGLFYLWEFTTDWKKAAELARQIAELPEREEVEQMREILFRGKRVDNGEWVEGDLLIYADTAQIWVNGKHGKENYPVNPETVGQYTEVIDEDKNKIFEGDLIRSLDDTMEIDTNDIAVVKYENAGFILQWEEGDEEMLSDVSVCGLIFDLKKVGNIHDNPELLESES